MHLNYEKYTAAEVLSAIESTDDSPVVRDFAAVTEQYGKMINEQILAAAGKDEGDGLVVTLPEPTCPIEEIALKVRC